MLAYALATYGAAATDARADLLGFGAPNWLGSAARHFGIDLAAADARFTDYTAANELVLINGVERLGLDYQLPAFTGLSGVPPRIRAQLTHPKLRSRLMRQKRVCGDACGK